MKTTHLITADHAASYAYMIEELLVQPTKQEARNFLKEILLSIGTEALLDPRTEYKVNSLGKAIKRIPR